MSSIIAVLIQAIIVVESGGDANAIGDNGLARGCLQIHQCVIDDVNRVYKIRYKSSSVFNKADAEDIAMKYLMYWGDRYQRETGKIATAEVLARIWNGGPNGGRSWLQRIGIGARL